MSIRRKTLRTSRSVEKHASTTMKDVHGLECPRCKIQSKFYEDFNSDSKKNKPYFGVISYVDHNLVKSVSSDQPKEDIPNKSASDRSSSVCYLQLLNEWKNRNRMAKEIKGENRLEKKKKIPRPSFYLPEHTGFLIVLKEGEYFTESTIESRIRLSDD